LKEIVKQQVAAAENTVLDEPFDYMTRELSEQDI